MKVFVISLIESTERQERIQNTLEAQDIKFEFFNAVDGRKGLPEDLINLPDDQHRRIFRSRPLTPGERGCYASHYRLWQKCIELNEPILIIEDDCLPTHFMKSSLNTLGQMHNRGYEYIRVEPQNGKATLLEEINGSHSVFWHDNRGGTRGYSISPSGAKKLLDKSKRWLCAVDNHIGESYRTGLKCTGIIPYLVLDPADMGTTIQNSGAKLKTPIYFKVTREIYRFYVFIRLSLWNMKNSRL
ncbi:MULTISPECIES: glycosyltransferase family 25 protein [Vibrio]|uniref:glycosyltransferase family 25 protein n=1 Tax=Vibrio TaxID=662 RepID=UPI002075232C|nr:MULTISPECIES: glycosyltransferase family 25 protein [Vibrio]USD32689.1 glycosyltransferase family 25 protein [Vibrio sp. SCSIO 43186]USD45729.1 glycosyltransferase family 25 protein [Vibrio sp. SCSIO 43145]USD69814.1 glycosyltransferase family 25 protein [Vibrio sp. SCSIO 43139]USD94719.1 beta-1,4-galactosyltransferase [Vibrio coralliilyticus]